MSNEPDRFDKEAKALLQEFAGRWLDSTTHEHAVSAVAARLRQYGGGIDRLLRLDETSAKAYNENLLEMADMRARIATLEAAGNPRR